MPLILPAATIDCDAELQDVYEWALAEFQVDDDGRPVLDDGKMIPINPLSFPLSNVMVAINGSRATLSLPRVGKANCVLDKLMNVPEPKAVKQPASKTRRRGESQADEVYLLTGVSERLLKKGILAEDATVTFTVSGTNITGQKS